MSSADFYVGLGDKAVWIGSLVADGGTAEADDADLFGPGPDGTEYTEQTFRRIVRELTDYHSDDQQLGYSAERGESWPWPYPNSADTDMVYAFNNGSIHVFERNLADGDQPTGQYLIALHYPNATRKPARFPDQAEGPE